MKFHNVGLFAGISAVGVPRIKIFSMRGFFTCNRYGNWEKDQKLLELTSVIIFHLVIKLFYTTLVKATSSLEYFNFSVIGGYHCEKIFCVGFSFVNGVLFALARFVVKLQF